VTYIIYSKDRGQISTSGNVVSYIDYIKIDLPDDKKNNNPNSKTNCPLTSK
jgi:hypothetical protein